MENDEADLKLLEAAAGEAGALAMRYFRQNPNVWEKDGGSPVSEADIAVDDLLRTRLLAARPGYGWLSEETADDGSRLDRERVFLVDPIDGTRAFLAGDDCWSVSVAVVRNGRPVAAALNAPARAELFCARQGGGAWLGDQHLRVSECAEIKSARIAGPRGWLRTETFQRLGADLHPHVPSLAYRFALVAANRVDAAFASPRANDWDLAASDLLVHEAGGRLTALDGTLPLYNRETLRHGVLVATNAELEASVVAAIVAAEHELRERSRQKP